MAARATHGWRINSIGGFTRVIHHDLNPTATAVIPPSAPSQRSETPDEVIPGTARRPVVTGKGGRLSVGSGGV